MPGTVTDSSELREGTSLCGLLFGYFLGTATRKGKESPREQSYMMERCTVGNYFYGYIDIEVEIQGSIKNHLKYALLLLTPLTPLLPPVFFLLPLCLLFTYRPRSALQFFWLICCTASSNLYNRMRHMTKGFILCVAPC